MKDRIKCVFYIDKKRKGQSVRKFQKGKRDFFKNFTILSSVLFFCVLHSAIWIPKLQYQSEKSRLSEDIVYSNFFRRQPVSDEVLKKLKESVDLGGRRSIKKAIVLPGGTVRLICFNTWREPS